MLSARATTPLREAERITWHQDEPYGSTSIFAQWCVFAEARRAGLKVMLDGQGADEQLAGYHGSFPYYFASLIRQRRFAALLRAMVERRRWHGVPFASRRGAYLLPLLPRGLAHVLRRQRQTVGSTIGLMARRLRPHLGRSAFETAREQIGRPPIDGIGDFCVVLTQSSNLAMLLHWEDRNSMAHSIEARVPFLDHRLVEFSIGLGDRHKIVGGDTKRVLRRAMDGILPRKGAQPARQARLCHAGRDTGFADRCASWCAPGSSRRWRSIRVCSIATASRRTPPTCWRAAGRWISRCGASSASASGAGCLAQLHDQITTCGCRQRRRGLADARPARRGQSRISLRADARRCWIPIDRGRRPPQCAAFLE